MNKPLQELLLTIPFNDVFLHTSMPQELIYFKKTAPFTSDAVLVEPTILITDDEKLITEESLILLLQQPNFTGLIIYSNKSAVFNDGVLSHAYNCDLPIIQISDENYLKLFEVDNYSSFIYNNLNSELEYIGKIGFKSFAQQISKILKRSVIFLDDKYEPICEAGQSAQIDKINKWLAINQKELIVTLNSKLHSKSIYTKDDYILFFMNTTSTQPCILLTEKNIVEWQTNLIEKFISLFLIFQQTNSNIKKRMYKFTNHFVHDLLYNKFASLSALIEQGKELGWDLKKPYHLMVLDFGNYLHTETDSDFLNYICKYLQSKNCFIYNQLITFPFENKVVILYPDEERLVHNRRKNFAINKAEEIIELLSQKWPNLNFHISIGNYCDEITNLHKSYREALLTLKFMSSWIVNKNVYHINDLGVYRMLFFTPKEVLNQLYKDILSPLFYIDETSETDYILTLESYFKNNGQINEIAKELFIHPNTLRNRLKKIEELTGLDIQKPEDCINLNIAIRIKTLVHI